MKKTTQISRLLIHCIIISTFIFSCQQEELIDVQNIENSQNLTVQKKGLQKQSTSTQTSSSLVIDQNLVLEDYTDCESVCIEKDGMTFYKKTGSDTRSSGPNSKLVSYEAYNTETQFVVNVTYTITSGTSGAEADITININNEAIPFEATNVASGSTVTHFITLPEGWKSCDEISFSISQSGLSTPITFNETYDLIGICNDSCDESFSYEENIDGSYTFTYISAEDLDAAEIKFTCPHIVSFEALDDKTYTVNPGNSHGSPTVLTWNGDIEACTAITFTLDFEADCDQNSGGFANLFTDFKVNEVSKKGTNPSIKFDCSAE